MLNGVLDPKKSGKTSCVGDIGTHAAHLAQFYFLEKKLTHVKSRFFMFCGSPQRIRRYSIYEYKI